MRTATASQWMSIGTESPLSTNHRYDESMQAYAKQRRARGRTWGLPAGGSLLLASLVAVSLATVFARAGGSIPDESGCEDSPIVADLSLDTMRFAVWHQVESLSPFESSEAVTDAWLAQIEGTENLLPPSYAEYLLQREGGYALAELSELDGDEATVSGSRLTLDRSSFDELSKAIGSGRSAFVGLMPAQFVPAGQENLVAQVLYGTDRGLQVPGPCSDAVEEEIRGAVGGLMTEGELRARLSTVLEPLPLEPPQEAAVADWEDLGPTARSYVDHRHLLPPEVEERLVAQRVQISVPDDWVDAPRTICFRTDAAWSGCVALSRAAAATPLDRGSQTDGLAPAVVGVHHVWYLPGEPVQILLSDENPSFDPGTADLLGDLSSAFRVAEGSVSGRSDNVLVMMLNGPRPTADSGAEEISVATEVKRADEIGADGG